ncbi:MAG: sensor histidine kinase [Cyanobacteria bacterium P01_A01_bin.17]
MTSSLKFLPNPFRFLLITEWVMLASCGSLAMVEAWQGQMIPVQHIMILVLLGLMGLFLPSGKLIVKVLYTALEIGLIFYGTVLGYLHILPTLYLIVVMRSCFLFESLGRWAVAGLISLLFISDQVKYIQRALPETADEQIHFGMHTLAETLVFGLSIFFVLKLTNKLLVERHMRQQLDLAHIQLQQYARQIEDFAAIQERNRIARDIHDSLGHVLTSLNIQLSTAVKLWSVDVTKVHPFLDQAQQLGTTAMKEVRRSVSTLRQDAADDLPLEAELDALVENVQAGTDLAIHTKYDCCAPLPPQIAKTVYRLVQEALTNISKHAQATEVQIQLHATQDQIYLTVADNGRGFDLNQNRAGFGLQGMEERIAVVKGRCQIKTQPGAGCRLVVEIPLSNGSSG